MKMKMILVLGIMVLLSGFVFADINSSEEKNATEGIVEEVFVVNESEIVNSNNTVDFEKNGTIVEVNETLGSGINNTVEEINDSIEEANETLIENTIEIELENNTINESLVNITVPKIDVPVASVSKSIETFLNFIGDSFSDVIDGVMDISARLTFENETPIPDQEIRFFENEMYIDSGVTDSEGYAYTSFNFSEYGSGEYIFRVEFNGSEKFNLSSSSSIFTASLENKTVSINETDITEEIVETLKIVERTEFSDVYSLGGNKYQAIVYEVAVNMMDSNGEYKPYEDITNFSFDGDKLVLKWNNKSVKMYLYDKGNKDIKEKFKDKDSFKKVELDFHTNIKKEKGRYYFDHTLNKEKQPKKVGYDIETENVKCVPDGRALICDEQRIDFEEAFEKQGIKVSVSENNVEFEGEDLSYIDPEITLSSSSSVLKVSDNCSSGLGDNGNGLIGVRDSDSGYEEKSIYFYSTNLIPDDADIESVKVNGSIGDIYDNNCSGDVQLRFTNIDYDDVSDWQDSSSGNLASIWDVITDFGDYDSIFDLSSLDGNSDFEKDLGSLAATKMQSLLYDNESFVFGMRGNPQFSSCSDKDCYLTMESISLVVTYYVYPTNYSINIGDYSAWSSSGELNGTVEVDISDAINLALDDCIADEFGYCDIPVLFDSETNGVINMSAPEVYFDTANYVWNVSDFDDGLYEIRIEAFDNGSYVNWTESGLFALGFNPLDMNVLSPENNSADADGVVNFRCSILADESFDNVSTSLFINGVLNETISSNETMRTDGFVKRLGNGDYNWSCLTSADVFSNDVGSHMLNVNTSLPLFEFKGNGSEVVASFLGNGGLDLAGGCSVSEVCVESADGSLVFLASDNTTVAYVDYLGNACFEANGSCGNYEQGTCNPSMDAFVVQDGLGLNVSYVDFDGGLCLTGGLNENV